MKRALIIDDDHFFHQVIKFQLENNEMECHTCKTFACAMEWMVQHGTPDIILLDYDLGPGEKSGIDICRLLKKELRTPLIMVSGDDRIKTIVACLDAGADQYILKPYAIEELLARMRAAFRLYDKTPDEMEEPVMTKGDMSLHTQSGELTVGDQQIRLTDMETAVCKLLLHDFGSTLDRNDLCQSLYCRDFDPVNRSLDVLIGRLRKKLATITDDYLIKNVRAKGYRLYRVGIRSTAVENGKIATGRDRYSKPVQTET